MLPASLDTPTLRRTTQLPYGDLPLLVKQSTVVFQHGRAFIPLASNGCGVGCKYCYIDNPAERISALPASRVNELLQTVRAYMDDRPLEARPVLAIGCDTEVAVSPETVTNALVCLDFAREHNLPVQLATKFPLHASLRQALDHWPYTDSPPVIFTTITTIALSKRIEPNAPTPAERAANFRPHSPAWRSYALIKPFLAIPNEDRRDLIELLRTRRPDGVVVGIRYRRAPNFNTPGDAHPVASDWIATLPSATARRLATQLSDTGLRVFMNTQCVTAWHNRSSDGQVVKEKFPHLCVGCGRCR
jgi:hypothetical protein